MMRITVATFIISSELPHHFINDLLMKPERRKYDVVVHSFDWQKKQVAKPVILPAVTKQMSRCSDADLIRPHTDVSGLIKGIPEKCFGSLGIYICL